jgi:hypothetical protein
MSIPCPDPALGGNAAVRDGNAFGGQSHPASIRAAKIAANLVSFNALLPNPFCAHCGRFINRTCLLAD